MDFEKFKDQYLEVPVEHYPDSVDKKPLVSVSVVTFQHVNYIKKCLDGILMQETDFAFEILLGEDGSKDGTREICIKYAQKYPDKIKLFLHNRKNNIAIDGSPTGRFNFVYNLFSARSKYIALCEGDDYWTNPKKLQRQVDFLEENPDYNICFHPVTVIDEKNILNESNKKTKSISYFDDLIIRNFIHTPSCIIRRQSIPDELPSWYFKLPIGDWPLYLLAVSDGKIKMIKGTMAIYRIHSAGVWSQKNSLEVHYKWGKTIMCIYKEFDAKYHDQFLKAASFQFSELLRYNFAYKNSFQFTESISLYYKTFRYRSFKEFFSPLKWFVKSLILQRN